MVVALKDFNAWNERKIKLEKENVPIDFRDAKFGWLRLV